MQQLWEPHADDKPAYSTLIELKLNDGETKEGVPILRRVF